VKIPGKSEADKMRKIIDNPIRPIGFLAVLTI
jgi:hypothetical protein